MLPFHALFVVASILGQPGNLPSFIKKYSKTMTFFYEASDPAQGPILMKAFLEKGNIEDPWYENKAHVLSIICSQFADIARGNPKLVRAYEDEFAKASLAGRKFLLKVLALCGDAETAKKTEKWLSDEAYAENRPGIETLKKILSGPPRVHVTERPAKTPDDLDLLWANFFITGEYPAVGRILDVFDQPDRPENAVLKRVARWSLASNLQQHKQLVKVVMEHKTERAPGSKKVIGEIMP